MTRIRAATPEDAAEVMEVRVSVKENIISLERLAELGIDTVSIAEMFRGSHVGFCAEEGGAVIAFSMGDLGDGSIFALFVRPEHEGRGLGKQLLSATVDALRRHGHQRLVLFTGPDTRAFAFYRRQGWRPTGVEKGEDVELELLIEGGAS